MNADPQNGPLRFDPFADRRSRDIRNGLSQAFAEALDANDRTVYRRCAQKWLATGLPAEFEAYIGERLNRYDRILAQDGRRHSSQPFATAVAIWNIGLFFEVHEYLETIWQRTTGDQHQALKGLIKAAGVYIHLENHNRPAARRLSQKAWHQMRDHAQHLGFIANLDVLLGCMQRLEADPPRLEFTATVDSS